LDGEAPEAGAALPPFFHQLYFWTARPPQALGRDGHPKVGGIIPDMGLPRRMWAGGRLRFHAPLIAGQTAQRETTCENHVLKQGRSGPLGFVTLRHELRQNGRLCLSEWQDLVYREEADPAAAQPTPPVAPLDEETAETWAFDTTMLFRYSALTFNGHRIHYDLTYAREVEGYGGLVVHGPLLAQILMLKATDELGPLASFQFRATAPLLHVQTAEFCRKGTALWVRGQDGQMHMQAEAVPLSGPCQSRS
jgi:3-methylfumaryl-CoA hydratase